MLPVCYTRLESEKHTSLASTVLTKKLSTIEFHVKPNQSLAMVALMETEKKWNKIFLTKKRHLLFLFPSFLIHSHALMRP
jgi:hypothetical protein